MLLWGKYREVPWKEAPLSVFLPLKMGLARKKKWRKDLPSENPYEDRDLLRFLNSKCGFTCFRWTEIGVAQICIALECSFKDLVHYLLYCPLYDPPRKRFVLEFINTLPEDGINTTPLWMPFAEALKLYWFVIDNLKHMPCFEQNWFT